ncbi:MAG: hypothetical protein IJ730_00115 [Alphaproteobacteria bacterium]|nr:hypothetical protein [Alphaproteobacteria bacterium]
MAINGKNKVLVFSAIGFFMLSADLNASYYNNNSSRNSDFHRNNSLSLNIARDHIRNAIDDHYDSNRNYNRNSNYHDGYYDSNDRYVNSNKHHLDNYHDYDRSGNSIHDQRYNGDLRNSHFFDNDIINRGKKGAVSNIIRRMQNSDHYYDDQYHNDHYDDIHYDSRYNDSHYDNHVNNSNIRTNSYGNSRRSIDSDYDYRLDNKRNLNSRNNNRY